MKTDWSWVPSEEVNVPRWENVEGVDVEVMAAYFDVPSAVRFIYDDRRNEFIIDLKYLTDSESTELKEHGEVVLRVGKNTRRIYQILMDADLLGLDFHKKITFRSVVNAEHKFKENIDKFVNINKPNSSVVEKFLDWGIQNKTLNLLAG